MEKRYRTFELRKSRSLRTGRDRSLTSQLVMHAISHNRAKIIHCDLKPANLMVINGDLKYQTLV